MQSGAVREVALGRYSKEIDPLKQKGWSVQHRTDLVPVATLADYSIDEKPVAFEQIAPNW